MPKKMECIAPAEISEEQVLAYADEEADSATTGHIRRCAHCAERARAYARQQDRLRALFHRIECPDAHTLGEYHLGLLSDEVQMDIREHLALCSACSQELIALERFLKEAATPPTPTNLHDTLRHVVAEKTPPSQDIVARQAALATRGAVAAPSDVYQADDIKLVVGLEADGLHAGRKMLLGFTLREGQPLMSLSGARVQLKRGAATVATEHVDELGNFVFSGLISGEYQLILLTTQEQVVIETIVV